MVHYVTYTILYTLYYIMQIVTGIEVNSEAYFPKFWEYCPSAEGTPAIFLGNIPATEGNKPHYWSMMTVTICFVIPLIEMDSELEAIVNQVIKFKISTTQKKY